MAKGGAARFVTSATSAKGLPHTDLPEFGFIGRSNVGKSSLLGVVLRQPRLVRTSRTPGRTRLLNLFVFEERLALVDLPGYGYAKLSKTERQRLATMIRDYVDRREQLQGLVLVLDARREAPSDLDLATASAILESEVPLLLAVTKADLVPKTRRLHHCRRLERALGAPDGSALVVSSKTGEGRRELVTQLTSMASE